MTRYTQAVIFIAAAVSGVLNYDGLSSLVAEDDWWLKSLCALTGIAVALSLSLFWSHAFATVPQLTTGAQRWRGWAAILGGVVLIVCISTWWNLVAFTEDEVERLSGGGIVVQAEERLAHAATASAAYRAYQPQIVSFQKDVAAIRDAEIRNGGTSGFRSKGPISSLMGQVEDRLASLTSAIDDAERDLGKLRKEGARCLADLRKHIAAGDTGKAGTALACINRVTADMEGQDVPAAIRRGLSSLVTGVTRPANLYSDRQRRIVGGFLRDTGARAKAIARHIDAGKPQRAEPLTMARPNIMKGVLIHWRSIVPAIATALAIDLLPLVILILLVLLGDDRRKRELPLHDWRASELLEAAEQIDALKSDRSAAGTPAYIDLPPEEWRGEETGRTGGDPS